MEDGNSQKIKQITPRYYAQQCPVCNGFGTLKYGLKICQGCTGKGYVLVPTDKMEGLDYENNGR